MCAEYVPREVNISDLIYGSSRTEPQKVRLEPPGTYITVSPNTVPEKVRKRIPRV